MGGLKIEMTLMTILVLMQLTQIVIHFPTMVAALVNQKTKKTKMEQADQRIHQA
uniref:Uncharacterized protein n=1 Tax=Picea sitchensis TaxID=3332 RepID=A9NPG8_PICSI|nr:unknown [Picea sitchensis]